MNYLITGGTGSLGKTIAKRLLDRPINEDHVWVYSRGEMAQYEMGVAFGDNPRLHFHIGDVRDESRLRSAMLGMDYVIHAAALKQVPVCEYNPGEALLTNAIGTWNVCMAAVSANVGRVMVVSTDKAVNPVNMYGATKLCAEKMAVIANRMGATRFAACRYGNVFMSRGSVVPMFLRRAMDKLPIPVTDPNMTRFWITLPQAAAFILDCLHRLRGGEIFVPKLPSIRIVDLAEAVCPKCPVEFIGVRPGEKLHEVLITKDEIPYVDDHVGYYVIRPAFLLGSSWDELHPVPKDFVYESGTNDKWLSVADLAKILDVEV